MVVPNLTDPDRFDVLVVRNGVAVRKGSIRHVRDPQDCYWDTKFSKVYPRWTIRMIHPGEHRYGEGWLAEIPGHTDPDHFGHSCKQGAKETAISRVVTSA